MFTLYIIYMVSIDIVSVTYPPPTRGVIISQPKTSFLGMVFDGDHDFEGPRAPKSHLDTVNTNLSHHLGRPFISTHIGITRGRARQ